MSLGQLAAAEPARKHSGCKFWIRTSCARAASLTIRMHTPFLHQLISRRTVQSQTYATIIPCQPPVRTDTQHICQTAADTSTHQSTYLLCFSTRTGSGKSGVGPLSNQTIPKPWNLLLLLCQLPLQAAWIAHCQPMTNNCWLQQLQPGCHTCELLVQMSVLHSSGGAAAAALQHSASKHHTTPDSCSCTKPHIVLPPADTHSIQVIPLLRCS